MGNVMKKVAWVGRTASMVFGLALVLALMFGVATTALAGSGVGARFDLGKVNTVNAITKLVGSVGGPSLQIDNNSTNAAATAVDLQVEPGKAPMKVNSDTKVANLNADKLDNLDSSAFVRSAYVVTEFNTGAGSPGSLSSNVALCDEGDFALGGGFAAVDGGTELRVSSPNSTGLNANGWQVAWTNDETADSVQASVLCADVGTPHQ